MSWSDKYKRSIDCDNPSGFSQRAHCAARRKRAKGESTKSKSPFNEMHEVKSHRTVEQIAKKHRLEVSFIQKQLNMGIPIEHEHTKDKDLATDIALQHLDEIPDYYTRLKKMESDAKKEHKKFKDVKEGTLHHWFKGSKSKSGKPGWVQADGSPCANEPGETKTPKCFSSGRLKALKAKGKEGESLIKSAVRRKRQKDKSQQSKSGAAAPTYVSTFAKGRKNKNYVKAEPGIKEAMELNEAKKDKPGKGSGTKDACYHKVKSRYDVWPSAYASGALVKCRRVGADNWGTKTEESSLNYDWDTPIRERAERYCPKCEKLERRNECKYGPKYWDMFSVPAEVISNKKDYNVTVPHPGNMPEGYDHEYSMARSELSTIIKAAKRLKKKMKKGEGDIEAWVQSKITKAADYIDTAADYVDSGEMSEGQKCWPGYKKKGTQKLFGKNYNRCVKAESVSIEDVDGNHYAEFIDIIKPEPLKPSKGIGSKLLGEGPSFEIGGRKTTGMGGMTPQDVDRLKSGNPGAAEKIDQKYKEIRGGINLPLAKDKSKKETQLAHYEPEGEQLDENPLLVGAGLAAAAALPYLAKKFLKPKVDQALDNATKTNKLPLASGGNMQQLRQAKQSAGMQEENLKTFSQFMEDWQKVNRQDKTDGLSQAAVNAYRRENPGSKLQTAVTEKKPTGKRAKRRANFCRRMKGMKNKLTSAKTARDPDSRINKALRRWNCH